MPDRFGWPVGADDMQAWPVRKPTDLGHRLAMQQEQVAQASRDRNAEARRYFAAGYRWKLALVLLLRLWLRLQPRCCSPVPTTRAR